MLYELRCVLIYKRGDHLTGLLLPHLLTPPLPNSLFSSLQEIGPVPQLLERCPIRVLCEPEQPRRDQTRRYVAAHLTVGPVPRRAAGRVAREGLVGQQAPRSGFNDAPSSGSNPYRQPAERLATTSGQVGEAAVHLPRQQRFLRITVRGTALQPCFPCTYLLLPSPANQP